MCCYTLCEQWTIRLWLHVHIGTRDTLGSSTQIEQCQLHQLANCMYVYSPSQFSDQRHSFLEIPQTASMVPMHGAACNWQLVEAPFSDCDIMIPDKEVCHCHVKMGSSPFQENGAPAPHITRRIQRPRVLIFPAIWGSPCMADHFPGSMWILCMAYLQ